MNQLRYILSNKKSKYGSRKTIVNGIKYDSKKEARYGVKLQQLEKAGIIKDLQRQVKYELQPSFKLNGKTIRSISYIADFTYIKDGELHIIDCKGFRTTEYKLKKKLFEYKYQKEIEEI